MRYVDFKDDTVANEDVVRNDPADGLPAPTVGAWAEHKHELLRLYVQITGAARAKYLGGGPGKGGATFIDLYCGAGRAHVKGTDRFIDGSPLVAWTASHRAGSPFTEIYLADHHALWLEAAERRLRDAGAPVFGYAGTALEAATALTGRLNRFGLHFALIEPFDLDLPFELLSALASFKRMDLLIHVSAMELQRNWNRYSKAEASPLDRFAPGWRQAVDLNQSDKSARLQFIRHWVSLLGGLGFGSAPRFELITGPNNIPLYWMVLVAKHEIATKLWAKAVQFNDPQDGFGF